jgi:hypothetical protein
VGWGPGGGSDGPSGRRNTPLVVLLVLVAVALVGGGVFLLTQGDERSEEEQAYIDALTDSAEASEGEDTEIPLSEDENRCLATAAVDAVGIEELREVGTPEEVRDNDSGDALEEVDIDLEQAGAYYDRARGCVDFRDVLTADLEDQGLSSEQVECVNRQVGDDLLRDLIVAGFAEDDDAAQEAEEATDEATESCDLPS